MTTKYKLYAALLAASMMVPGVALAGVGGSSGLIESAIASGSVDAIVAELERAEYIPTSGAIPSVLQLVDHPSARVREAAGWWLGRRGVRSTVVTMAQQRFAGTDPVAAANICDALRGMLDSTNAALVGAYVAKPLDEASGISALVALGAFGTPKGLPLITPALFSQYAGVRAQGLRAVRQLRANVGDKVITTGTAYIPLLQDSDPTVRREAAITLGFLGQAGINPDAVSSGVTALIGVVASDSSVIVRRAAAWALGEIGNNAALAALQSATSDADASVRSIANAAKARLN